KEKQDGNGVRRAKRNGASLAADPTLTGVWVPEGTLDARRLQYCPKAASLSPGARAGAGSVRHWAIARTLPNLAAPRPGFVHSCLKRLSLVRRSGFTIGMNFESPALSTLRPRGFTVWKWSAPWANP